MKKLISIILSVLIICPLLTACGGKGMGIGKVEQTNKELSLVVYAWQSNTLDSTINEFSVKYPDVKLNVERITQDDMEATEFSRKFSSAAMAGKGPDIICLKQFFNKTSDVYKMMSSGVFADMNEFFDADKDFKIEDFNQPVFNAGIYKGKRYIIPIEYTLPINISTETMIKETGFNLANCKDYFGFTGEIEKYLTTNIKNPQAPRVFLNPQSFNDYYFYMGIKILDYENKIVNIDTPEFKKATEIYKKLYLQDLDKDNAYTKDVYGSYKAKKGIFIPQKDDEFLYLSMIISEFDRPVGMLIHDIKGGVQAEIGTGLAVRNNSANKQNAYNFIKILNSSETTNSRMSFDIPIRNSCVGKDFKTFTSGKGIVDKAVKPITQADCDEYYKMTQSVTGAYFRTPFKYKLFEIMEPYFKDEKGYEECIKNAKDQMEIYITE